MSRPQLTRREQRLLRRATADIVFVAGNVMLHHGHERNAVRDALHVLRTADPVVLRRLNRLLLDDLRSPRFAHRPDARGHIANALYRIYQAIDLIDAHPAAIAQRIAA